MPRERLRRAQQLGRAGGEREAPPAQEFRRAILAITSSGL
jgi:hypothetical protein